MAHMLCRHMVYPHVAQKQPKTASAMAEDPVHQYFADRGDMISDLKRAVSPTTTHLNHRQRFALQQSFILQTCTSHYDLMKPYKQMLRKLALEWYQRRATTKEEGVSDTDICFMLQTMHSLRRESNPHWWFVSSVV